MAVLAAGSTTELGEGRQSGEAPEEARKAAAAMWAAFNGRGQLGAAGGGDEAESDKEDDADEDDEAALL